MRILRYTFCVAAIYFVPQSLYALTCGPATINVPTAGALRDSIESGVCSQIQSGFQTGNLGNVMSYMAKAYAASSRGLMADYHSNMQIFSLGVSASVAVSNISLPTSTADVNALSKRFSGGGIPDAGIGTGANVNIGISFRHLPFRRRGYFDPKNFNFYLSGSYLPPTVIDTYTLKILTASIYAQYKLFQPKKIPLGLMTWGGLDLGIGYGYASQTAVAASATSLKTFEFDQDGQKVKYTASGSLGLAYEAHTIPLELSTNVSLLYFLSLAVGASADFQILSSAKLEATISGPVRVNGLGGDDDYARFVLAETGKANGVSYRVFFGPQINVWKIRIFVLAHLISDQSLAATFGARFVW